MAYHRTFIAVNLPERAKKSILNAAEDLRDIPAKWTDERNFHLTLIFLGDITEDEIASVGEKIKEVVNRTEPFLIKFTNFVYGPKDFSETRHPRMIWLEGEECAELEALQSELEEALGMSGNKNRKKFRPHITIAKIKSGGISAKKLPVHLNKKLELTVPVNSIEFMESELKPGGPRYAVLLSAPFMIE